MKRFYVKITNYLEEHFKVKTVIYFAWIKISIYSTDWSNKFIKVNSKINECRKYIKIVLYKKVIFKKFDLEPFHHQVTFYIFKICGNKIYGIWFWRKGTRRKSRKASIEVEWGWSCEVGEIETLKYSGSILQMDSDFKEDVEHSISVDGWNEKKHLVLCVTKGSQLC